MVTRDLMQGVDERHLTDPSHVKRVGAAADRVAARHAFTDYRARRADNTVRRQNADLALFAEYLAEVGIQTRDLATRAEAWQGISWGLVAGFVQWMLQRGYAIGSVNVRLSTVKTYAKLAHQAGGIPDTEHALIRTVRGYARREARNLDEKREAAQLPTRRGCKKDEPVSLTPNQARQLKEQPNTPQGRRDWLIMVLLLDHGLRVGEVAGLSLADFSPQKGELRFYRKKVDKVQTHRLTANALAAMRAYLQTDALPFGPLLRASRKGGRLIAAGMTARCVSARVRTLGEAVGIEGLSPHDCRHF